jgi:hypothetical protein
VSAREALPWVLSCTTLTTMWLAGNKSAWAWRLGLASQALWGWWIVATEAWGLLPMTCALVVVYARNLRAWART